MDWQRKRKTQTEWALFPDIAPCACPSTAPSPPGELRDDFELYYGVDQDGAADRLLEPGTKGPSASGRPAWLQPDRVVVDEALSGARSQRYDIYCSVCHGVRGQRTRPVALRAKDLARRLGLDRPRSPSLDNAKSYSNGELFHIASHGISTMKATARRSSRATAGRSSPTSEPCRTQAIAERCRPEGTPDLKPGRSRRRRVFPPRTKGAERPEAHSSPIHTTQDIPVHGPVQHPSARSGDRARPLALGHRLSEWPSDRSQRPLPSARGDTQTSGTRCSWACSSSRSASARSSS